MNLCELHKLWSREVIKTEIVDVIWGFGFWAEHTCCAPILVSIYCGHCLWIHKKLLHRIVWMSVFLFCFLHALFCESNKRVSSVMVLCSYDAMKLSNKVSLMMLKRRTGSLNIGWSCYPLMEECAMYNYTCHTPKAFSVA